MSAELKRLIHNYGRACHAFGNPAWESKAGEELLAFLDAAPQAAPELSTASRPEAVAPSDVRQFLAALVIRNRDDCGMFPQVADEVEADDAAYERISKLIDFYYPRKALAARAAPGLALTDGEAQ